MNWRILSSIIWASRASGVIVLADTVYGWNAFAMTVPDTESDIHVKMQRAVEELRIRYEIERC